MIKQQKYTSVIPVYHNPATLLTTYEREDKAQICFDSKSEYRCYQMLRDAFDPSLYNLDIHVPIAIGGVRWKIDFSITARRNSISARVALASILNSLHDTQHHQIEQIFIEYKGFLDKNFCTKFSTIATTAPHFAKTIILVSEHTSAFGCHDDSRKRFYCHPVMASTILQQALNNTLKGYDNG